MTELLFELPAIEIERQEEPVPEPHFFTVIAYNKSWGWVLQGDAKCDYITSSREEADRLAKQAQNKGYRQVRIYEIGAKKDETE